jgi:predicted MFS family arabinose efflux permease
MSSLALRDRSRDVSSRTRAWLQGAPRAGQGGAPRAGPLKENNHRAGSEVSKSLKSSSSALLLAACFLVLFTNGGGRFAVSLMLKPIVEEFGWSRSDLSIAIAVFLVVSATTMFAAGKLVDRIGPRLVLGGGLVVSAIGIGAMSAISAPWHAIALYGVLYALGNGAASMIPVGVIVTRAFPVRTGIANAVVMSGMSVGQLVVIAALAAVLTMVRWPSVFLWLGLVYLALVPFLVAAIPTGGATAAKAASQSAKGMNIAEAARTRQFWLLLGVYAICGLDDFFVTTHVVAFAQDRGAGSLLAGNLLALMGLTGLVGVVAAGFLSDRSGPMWPTALQFAARVASFGLIMVDQSELSVAVFALVFGATFLITAPLTVVFVQQSFGTRHLGALTGLITMVHQIFGGIGAFLGAAVFDATKRYDDAFAIMLVASALALLLTLMLKRPKVSPAA